MEVVVPKLESEPEETKVEMEEEENTYNIQ